MKIERICASIQEKEEMEVGGPRPRGRGVFYIPII